MMRLPKDQRKGMAAAIRKVAKTVRAHGVILTIGRERFHSLGETMDQYTIIATVERARPRKRRK